MRPLILLLVCGVLIRTLPALTRPAAPAEDCLPTPSSPSGSDISSMERCLALRTSDVELMIDLAAAYESAGQSDRAQALYRRALAIDPDDGELRRRLERLTSGGRGGA